MGKQAGKFKNNLIVLFMGPISSFFGRHIKSFRSCKMGQYGDLHLHAILTIHFMKWE